MSAGPGPMQVTVAPGQAIVRDFTGGTTEPVLVTVDEPTVWDIAAPGVAKARAVGFRFVRVTESVIAGDIGPCTLVADEDVPLASIGMTPATTVINADMISDRKLVAPWNMMRSGPALPNGVNAPLAPEGTIFIVTATP